MKLLLFLFTSFLFCPGILMPQSTGGFQTSIEGYSVQNRPIYLYQMGNGSNKILYFGAFHGNELQGRDILLKLMDYLKSNPSLLKDSTALFVPTANPDAASAGTRVNGNKVDINRNFPAANWAKKYRYSRYNPGKRTPEPETKTIIQIVKEYQPDVIITIHTPHHFINYDGPAKDIAIEMAKKNHYAVKSYMGYRTPGSFGTYMGKERNYPVITLELSKSDSEKAWEENKNALLTPIENKEAQESRFTKANVNFYDACRLGLFEAVNQFLIHGAQINAKDASGWTGLHYAVYYRQENIVRLLIEHGADVKSSDNLGWTPLIQAAQAGGTNFLTLLINAGADINARDSFGNTALIEAGRNGNTESVSLLIAKGADVHYKDGEGKSALLDTARNGFLNTMKALVEGGADINERDSFGRTPLMEAAYFDYPSMVRYLVKKGADLNCTDNQGKTAITDAAEQHSRASLSILKRARAAELKKNRLAKTQNKKPEFEND